MKKRVFIFLISSLFFCKGTTASYWAYSLPSQADSIPAMLLGSFMDDYGIKYTVTDTLFIQHPGVKYHIIKWNLQEQYFIVNNDINNPSEKGLFTRIDYMPFENMEPFKWGFCYTVYNAASPATAEATVKADRINPRKGCNGYPFSRMKRVE